MQRRFFVAISRQNRRRTEDTTAGTRGAESKVGIRRQEPCARRGMMVFRGITSRQPSQSPDTQNADPNLLPTSARQDLI